MLPPSLSDAALFLTSLGLCGAAAAVQLWVGLGVTPSPEALVIPATLSVLLATLITMLWRAKRQPSAPTEDSPASSPSPPQPPQAPAPASSPSPPQPPQAPAPASLHELLALSQIRRNFTLAAGTVMHDINNNLFIYVIRLF